MADLRKGASYFTRYHLPRDIYANLGPFIVFGTVAFVLFVPAESRLNLWNAIRQEGFSSTLLIFIPGIVLVSIFVGIIADRFVYTPYKFIVSRFPDRLGPDKRYRKIDKDIIKLYKKYYPNGSLLVSSRLGAKINQLIWIARRQDPEGYYHTYRQYAYLAFYRVSIAYSLVIMVCTGAFPLQVSTAKPIVYVVFSIVLIMLMSAFRYTNGSIVSNELNLINSFDAWVSNPLLSELGSSDRESIQNVGGNS